MEKHVIPARPSYAVLCLLVLSAMCLLQSKTNKKDRLTVGEINCKPNESIYLPSIWQGGVGRRPKSRLVANLLTGLLACLKRKKKNPIFGGLPPDP